MASRPRPKRHSRTCACVSFVRRCSDVQPCPAESADWSASAQHLAESLTRFGSKIEPRGINQAQHPIDVNEGRFQLAYRNWGTGTPHPQFSYIEDPKVRNTDQAQGGMKY